jgi:hypothetical protein
VLGQLQVFGPKGSLLATNRDLFFRSSNDNDTKLGLEGQRVILDPPFHETNNPISYFVDCTKR